jgi:hypothetical protein
MSIQTKKNLNVATEAKPINQFAELHLSSSDEDDVEEGEIVEDTMLRAQEKRNPIDLSAWRESGVKGIFVKIPKPEPEAKQQVTYVRETYVAEGDGISFYYYLKCKGMSWVDIEYATDDE